jgi:excisionase family DNA binding protein
MRRSFFNWHKCIFRQLRKSAVYGRLPNVTYHRESSFSEGWGRHTFPDLRTEDKLALRVNEASVAAGISRSTIYKLMSSGQLRTTKVGGRRLVLREDLQKLLLAGAE